MTVVFVTRVDAACRASENSAEPVRVAMKDGLYSIHVSLMHGRVGTALVGSSRQLFGATLRKLAEID